MKYYMMSCRKEPGCPVGLLDVVLFDKSYDDWDSVEYGYFPWYANSVRRRPHEKLPEGLIMVGRSKKYIFGVRQITRDFYAMSSDFYKACLSSGVDFSDIEKVDFKVSGGGEVNPVSYYVGMFDSYDIDSIVSSDASLSFDEFGKVVAFSQLDFNDGPFAPVFKIKGLRAQVDTLFCNEDFVRAALDNNVRGVDFLALDEFGSAALESI
ncbi:hypothetical protein [Pseudomonas sp. LAM2023]|uniref:hypothetical protein n=1 Tax=Pseudomonas sp. LAM2023 TaxID=2800477 RepID=UPI00190DC51F|nr:hypothetical protein [Pseudomonas sp. LAM2023]